MFNPFIEVGMIMTREEEIEEMAIQAHKDYASTGYNVEDFREYTRYVLKWAYEHPKSPWRDAEKELPKEDERVFVRYEWVRDHLNSEYEIIIDHDYTRAIYRGDDCWEVEGRKYFDDYNTVTHWMLIPETPEGDEI